MKKDAINAIHTLIFKFNNIAAATMPANEKAYNILLP